MLSVLTTTSAFADARAWLDRDRIAVGETTTLNVETDESGADAPDYSVLQRDFDITGNTSSRQVQLTNGTMSSRMLYAVALQPRRDGVLSVPALRVGTQTTAPLTLTVTAAEASRAGGPVFIESAVDDTQPYVQQAVGYTVKLFYNRPIVSGQLDQDAPDGASLQRIGSDQQYTRMVNGARYTVVERQFLLIPEHSGALTIPGARFQGRSAGGFFDDVFGDGQRTLSANGAPRFVTVRAAPANSPQPWLPLRGLSLRYLSTPQSARVGEAFEVTVQASVDGATAAQMPELQLPPVDGAQVFADPVQIDESVENGRPKAVAMRKFSIVPSHAGVLRVVGPRLQWWDVQAGATRTASLPDVTVTAAPALPGSAAFNAPTTANDADSGAALAPQAGADGLRIPGVAQGFKPWPLIAAGFALLWLLTLAWALHQRVNAASTPATSAPRSLDATPVRAGVRQLKAALATGTLGEVADVLCAMAPPPVHDADALRSRLANPQQRDAVELMQRARWSDGDGSAARTALRTAFASGPDWVPASVPVASALPPLYPER